MLASMRFGTNHNTACRTGIQLQISLHGTDSAADSGFIHKIYEVESGPMGRFLGKVGSHRLA
jgi:hypothetical protein